MPNTWYALSRLFSYLYSVGIQNKNAWHTIVYKVPPNYSTIILKFLCILIHKFFHKKGPMWYCAKDGAYSDREDVPLLFTSYSLDVGAGNIIIAYHMKGFGLE